MKVIDLFDLDRDQDQHIHFLNNNVAVLIWLDESDEISTANPCILIHRFEKKVDLSLV